MSAVTIRPEREGDAEAIRDLTARAFDGTAHSDGSEPAIVERLRVDGDLTLSLVAQDEDAILGHIAFSPVTITDRAADWFDLGPVSVLPSHQRDGIGSALVRRGIADMRARRAKGIVLLGDPAYYTRFGFAHDPGLAYPGPPPEYFQFLLLDGAMPQGTVRYAPAFG